MKNNMILSENKQKSIIEIIKKCGKNLLSAHDIGRNENDISSKEGAANFVTVYDVKTQDDLISGLKDVIPDALFFAEEQDNSMVDFKDSFCFFIDPIDGTTNFIHGMNMSAVSVALSYNGETVFGAVYDPYADEMFWASRGDGAYLNGKKIYVSNRSLENALIMFGTAPYDREVLAENFFPVLYRVYMNCADIRRSGSAALDLCYVACGRAEAYIEAILSPWDFAAGKLILEEAGGKLTSFNGNDIILGEKSSVLCSNTVLHSKMLGLINQ
ncbi:MAG: inositol monophosphatase [Oscillospiraceae bacterium]|nr:inositol monophosphatase [Oscillospiraceae bacterium]